MVAGLASIRTSRVSSAICVSFLSFGRFGQVLQTLQTGGPVLVEELAEAVHLGVIGPVEATGSVPPFDDQLRFSEHTEVLGDGRPGDVAELGGNLGRRELFGPHQLEDLSAAGLDQSPEGGVHGWYISLCLRKSKLTIVSPKAFVTSIR